MATNAASIARCPLLTVELWSRRIYTSDGRLVLRWNETGGPPVTMPTHEGFGTRVVARMVQQSKGEVRFDWRPEGLACEVAIFVNLAPEPVT